MLDAVLMVLKLLLLALMVLLADDSDPEALACLSPGGDVCATPALSDAPGVVGVVTPATPSVSERGDVGDFFPLVGAGVGSLVHCFFLPVTSA